MSKAILVNHPGDDRMIVPKSRAAIRWFGLVGAVACPIWMGMTGCTQAPSMLPAPPAVEQALIGKTKQEVLACAIGAADERTVGDETVLVFYKEASLLEESFAGSKSSVPLAHHGCLAHAHLREGRVREIHYHAVPPSYAGYDHCDVIFKSCSGR